MKARICMTIRVNPQASADLIFIGNSSTGLGGVLFRRNNRWVVPEDSMEGWRRLHHHFGVQSPTMVPSGSANQANVPVGIVTGGTSVLPPRDSALAR